MKRIGTNFLQKSEGSITNGLEFLSFTLQSFLIDVKPYLVSKLELMINPVFSMTIFIKFLTFLQLFLDCLVYLLDPLNKLVASIFIYLFIWINISPIWYNPPTLAGSLNLPVTRYSHSSRLSSLLIPHRNLHRNIHMSYSTKLHLHRQVMGVRLPPCNHWMWPQAYQKGDSGLRDLEFSIMGQPWLSTLLSFDPLN